MFRKRLLLLLLLPFSFSSSSFSLFLLLWVHYPRSISRFLAAGLDTSLSCATGLQLTAYIFLMSFSTSSFYLALGRFWCKLARYIFLVFLALKRLVNKLERMWKRWGGAIIATGVPFMVCLSSTALCHRKPASAGASRECCRSQGHDERDTCTIPAFACRGWEGLVQCSRCPGRNLKLISLSNTALIMEAPSTTKIHGVRTHRLHPLISHSRGSILSARRVAGRLLIRESHQG